MNKWNTPEVDSVDVSETAKNITCPDAQHCSERCANSKYPACPYVDKNDHKRYCKKDSGDGQS